MDIHSISNPYTAGGPVTDSNQFFGREDVFTWIKEKINNNNALVIYGQPRVGKTSILYQLSNQKLPGKFIPIRFDLQAHGGTLEEFLYRLALEIEKHAVRYRGGSLTEDKHEVFLNDPSYFENDFLPLIHEAQPQKIFLICLDEYDVVLDNPIYDSRGRSISQLILYLVTIPYLRFLFSIGSTGSRLIMLNSELADPLRTSQPKKITYLDKVDALQLITEPVKTQYSYTKRAQDLIFQQTAGHPYFIQLMCQEIYQKQPRQTGREVDVKDVEAAIEQVIESGEYNLMFFWQRTTWEEKWVLFSLSRLNRNQRSQEALEKDLSDLGVVMSPDDIRKALVGLKKERELIRQNNEWVIALFERWVQEVWDRDSMVETYGTREHELPQPAPREESFFSLAHDHFNKSEYQKAEEFLNKALELDPAFPRALLLRSRILIRHNKLKEARDMLEKTKWRETREKRRLWAQWLPPLLEDARGLFVNADAGADEKTRSSLVEWFPRLVKEAMLIQEGEVSAAAVEQINQALVALFNQLILHETREGVCIHLSDQMLRLVPNHPEALGIKRRSLFKTGERRLAGGDEQGALEMLREAETINLCSEDGSYADEIGHHLWVALNAYTRKDWKLASQEFDWVLHNHSESTCQDQIIKLAGESGRRARKSRLMSIGAVSFATVAVMALLFFSFKNFFITPDPTPSQVSVLPQATLKQRATDVLESTTALPTGISTRTPSIPTPTTPTPNSTEDRPAPDPITAAPEPQPPQPVTVDTVSRLVSIRTMKLMEVDISRVMTISGQFLAYEMYLDPDRADEHNTRHGVKVIDLITGKEVLDYFLKDSWFTFDALSFSPDGQFLAAGSSDHRIRLWEVKNGKIAEGFSEPCTIEKEEWKKPLHEKAVTAVGISNPTSDGERYLVSGISEVGFLSICEVLKGLRYSININDPVREIELSPDNRYIVVRTYNDADARVYDVHTRSFLEFLSHDNARVVSIAVSDERIATGFIEALGSEKRGVAIQFNTEAGVRAEPAWEPENIIDTETVDQLSFSADGSLLAAVYKGKLMIFDARIGEGIPTPVAMQEDGYYVKGMFTPDGMLFIAIKDEDPSDNATQLLLEIYGVN